MKLTAMCAVGAAAALLMAPSATAYPGGCFEDPFGRCFFAPISMFAPAGSPADVEAFGDTPDQRFAYLVTHYDRVPEFRIDDFELIKAQGLRSCEQLSNGMSHYEARVDLQQRGGYTDAVGANIHSAAVAVYCDWSVKHLVGPPT